VHWAASPRYPGDQPFKSGAGVCYAPARHGTG